MSRHCPLSSIKGIWLTETMFQQPTKVFLQACGKLQLEPLG